jgi:predicted Zn-dependent protease
VKALPIPDVALAIAKARFDRPGVFARRCPHEIDADRQRAMAMLSAGDVRGALAALRELTRREPGDAGARLGLATCEERAGDDPIATLEGVLADARMSRTVRDRAEERLGDRALGRGDLDEARRRYDAIAGRVLDEDHLRTLDVKRVATTDPAATAAIATLLVGSPRTGPDALRAHEELGRWAVSAPRDPMPRYLLARQSVSRGDFAHAAALLDEALSLPSTLARVFREAARMRLVVGCALEDREGVRRGLEAWTSAVPMPGNRDALTRALAARCVR